jgi:hypothetical protein
MRGQNDQWLADVVEALEGLGGEADVWRIRREARRVRRTRGDSVPESTDMIVQRTLENFCSESDTYAGSYDLFRMVYGKGRGVYRFNLPGLDRYKEDRRVPSLDELFQSGPG